MKSKGCSGWNRRNGDGMYILGMESSCDETSAAVVEMGGGTRRICSDIVASQIDVHRLYGGVVPEIASRAHIEAVSRITEEALRTAGVGLSDIGAIAVTTHPGLIGALLVGVNFAKSLAFANGIPLISVNHIHGHVAAAYLTEPTLEPPFLALVVSGGHTSLFHVRDYTDFSEIGATRDDAAGEAFDKIGRVIGMPYPGGAALDRLAYEGDPKAYDLPSPAIAGDTLDFSFSGLKTAALNIINSANQKGTPLNRADLAASGDQNIHGLRPFLYGEQPIQNVHFALVMTLCIPFSVPPRPIEPTNAIVAQTAASCNPCLPLCEKAPCLSAADRQGAGKRGIS